MRNKYIFIFIGLPRNVNEIICFIENIIKKHNAKVIFSTNQEIYNYRLPKECKIIINENDRTFQQRVNELKKLPQFQFMIQHLRLSQALKYIKKNNLFENDTIIYKARTDILNLEKIIIPLKPDEKKIYMYTDYAFASTYKVFKILDDFFFSKPEKYLDLDPIIDVAANNFLLSDKSSARFEWLTYPKMLSLLLPKIIFKMILKSKFERLLFFGPKKKNKLVNIRYIKDRIRFQSEVFLLWSVLKKGLIVDKISTEKLKLNPNRSPQKREFKNI